MQRSELLRLASEKSGKAAKPYHIVYGQRFGHISPAKKVGGWLVYDQRHVDQLATYLLQHARERRGVIQ